MKGLVIRLGGAGVCAAVLLAGGSTAQAACFNSTPASATYRDDPYDSAGAPEIADVWVELDRTCDVSVDPGLGPLYTGDTVFIYIDRDGDPATGSPDWRGADEVVGTVGHSTGLESWPVLGTWDGTRFSYDDAVALDTTGFTGGFSASPDRLGIANGTTAHFMVASQYRGSTWVDTDVAPDDGTTLALPVKFTSTIPAPVPPPGGPQPPAAPPAPAQPATTKAAAKQPAACKVPRVKGKAPLAALHALGGKGCAYSMRITHGYSSRVPKGRVIRTIPAAGATTKQRVRLVVSRGRRH